jgi:hypothetical protein
VLYIDNLLILSKSLDEVKKVKLALLEEFEMKDLGDFEFRSGIRVIRDQANKMISLNQAEYIIKIL